MDPNVLASIEKKRETLKKEFKTYDKFNVEIPNEIYDLYNRTVQYVFDAFKYIGTFVNSQKIWSSMWRDKYFYDVCSNEGALYLQIKTFMNTFDMDKGFDAFASHLNDGFFDITRPALTEQDVVDSKRRHSVVWYTHNLLFLIGTWISHSEHVALGFDCYVDFVAAECQGCADIEWGWEHECFNYNPCPLCGKVLYKRPSDKNEEHEEDEDHQGDEEHEEDQNNNKTTIEE